MYHQIKIEIKNHEKEINNVDCMGCCIYIFCFCTKLNASKVPAAVKNSFAKLYSDIATKCEKEDDKYEAGFKKDGNTMSAMFEQNATLTESEQ